MLHNEIVQPTVFAQLNERLRHLIVKANPLHSVGDTLVVTSEGTRDQKDFEIVSISTDSINGKGKWCLLGVYAPYGTINDIPAYIGGGFGKSTEDMNETIKG